MLSLTTNLAYYIAWYPNSSDEIFPSNHTSLVTVTAGSLIVSAANDILYMIHLTNCNKCLLRCNFIYSEYIETFKLSFYIRNHNWSAPFAIPKRCHLSPVNEWFGWWLKTLQFYPAIHHSLVYYIPTWYTNFHLLNM